MSRVRNHPGPEEKFFLLADQFARDPNVTPRAARVYIYLRSHRSGWETNVRRIGTAIGMGKNSVAAAIQELVDLGYVEREQLRDEQGRVGEMEYITYAAPRPHSGDTGMAAAGAKTETEPEPPGAGEPAGNGRNPNTGHRETGARETGNRETGTHKGTNSKGTNGKGTNEVTTTPNGVVSDDLFAEAGQPLEAPAPPPPAPPAKYTPQFEEWWQSYPKRTGSKKNAAEQFKAALKRGVPLAEIQAGTERLVAYVQAGHRSPGYCLDGERWLKRDMWEEELVAPQLQPVGAPHAPQNPWEAYLDDSPTPPQTSDYSYGHTVIEGD